MARILILHVKMRAQYLLDMIVLLLNTEFAIWMRTITAVRAS